MLKIEYKYKKTGAFLFISLILQSRGPCPQGVSVGLLFLLQLRYNTYRYTFRSLLPEEEEEEEELLKSPNNAITYGPTLGCLSVEFFSII